MVDTKLVLNYIQATTPKNDLASYVTKALLEKCLSESNIFVLISTIILKLFCKIIDPYIYGDVYVQNTVKAGVCLIYVQVSTHTGYHLC